MEKRYENEKNTDWNAGSSYFSCRRKSIVRTGGRKCRSDGIYSCDRIHRGNRSSRAGNAEKQVFETEEDTKTADTGEFTINNGLLTKYTGTAETVTIPSNVRRIGKSAFQNNKYIKSVIIPGNVRKIEILAFYGCSNLESVTMAEGVEEIGMQTFSETHLKSVVLPKSIIKMDRLVFTSCNRLTSIDFTEGTYNINGDIIGSCAALTEIKVSGNNTRYQVKITCYMKRMEKQFVIVRQAARLI